jgi:hypothetical protein
MEPAAGNVLDLRRYGLWRLAELRKLGRHSLSIVTASGKV